MTKRIILKNASTARKFSLRIKFKPEFVSTSLSLSCKHDKFVPTRTKLFNGLPLSLMKERISVNLTFPYLTLSTE